MDVGSVMNDTPGGPRTATRRWARLRRLATGVALATPVAVLAVSFFWAYFSVHPPKRAPRRTPANVGIPYEEVTFPSADGARLAGWLAVADKAKAVILLCHGFGDTRADLLWHLAFLHRAGFSVCLFDFRAHGQSDGDTCTFGYREVNDLLGAVRYLRERRETASQKIGALGVSMGAAVCLMGAARTQEIDAVVADNPYAGLDRAVRQRFRAYFGPFAPVFAVPARFFGEKMTGINAATVSPLREVAGISPRPLLLIHTLGNP